jgi:hypothetical protein
MQTKFSDGSVMVAGQVTKDAELKHVGEKKRPVTSFSISAGKRKDTTTIFVTIKAWGRLAHYAANAIKGDAICAIGRIESREYNGKNYDDLVCDWLNIASNDGGAFVPQAVSQKQQSIIDTDFAELQDDDGDSLPF